MNQQMAVRLNRLTGFDHQCRVKYAISLGEGERRVDSGMVDDVSDLEGRGMFTWCPRARVGDLVTTKPPVLKLNVEMILANPISETLVTPTPAASMAPPVPSPCYDRDMQAWYLEADVNNEDFLRLRLVYKDVRNVPRNHLR
jgi:hypothetical protein